MRVQQLTITACVIAFCAFSVFARPQYTDIQIKKPFHCASLSGVALDWSNEGVPKAIVEECRRGWTDCVQFGTTDAAGHFAAGKRVYGKHFLRVRADGFDPLLVIVIVKPFFFTHLKLRLQVAS